MKAHEYKVINADGQQIDRITTGEKNRGIASMKLRVKYGSNAVFLKLEYAGEVELIAR
jgi:hypothetical protein